MKNRFTWRYFRFLPGRPEQHRLSLDGVEVVTVARCPGGWYFIGRTRNGVVFNSSHEPATTLFEVKEQAEKWAEARA